MPNNIQESLEQIMELDGAVGAALVDYESGMTLGTKSTSTTFDMEMAAAGNTEVVRAQKDVIDQLRLDEKIQDILISLNNQYHLIRIFHQNDTIFTYVVLNKEKSNLALARMTLENVDQSLKLGMGDGASQSSSQSSGQSSSQSSGHSSSGGSSSGSSGRSSSGNASTSRSQNGNSSTTTQQRR